MERNYLEGLGVDGRIVKWISKSSYVKIVNTDNFEAFDKATCFKLPFF